MRRNLFLYLTLACFLGLIAIFVVDGYMGVYDTIYVTAGEMEERIEADFWMRQEGAWKQLRQGVNWGDKVPFRYTVENHQFSTYSADVEVSVWRSQEKVLDLPSQPLSVDAFGKASVKWVVDSTKLLPRPPRQYEGRVQYNYTVIIKRGQIERKVIVSINYPAPKSVGVPPLPPR